MLDKVVFLLDLCTCSQQYNMAYSGLFFQELGSFEYPCVCVLITQSCPAFCDPHGVQSTRLCCPWNSPVKNTGVGCHSLLQGIFLTQGLNLGLLHCRQTFTFFRATREGGPDSCRHWDNCYFVGYNIEKTTQQHTCRPRRLYDSVVLETEVISKNFSNTNFNLKN